MNLQKTNDEAQIKQIESPSFESSQNRKSILNFDFEGNADIKSNEENAKIINLLNQEATEISNQIITEIKSNLKGIGINISVNIEFKPGSIVWDGVIIATDFLARLDGSIGGAKIIAEAARFAINKIMRNILEEKHKITIENIKTKVTESEIRYNDGINFFTKFLWWCAGGVYEILKDCPEDKAKYQTIGTAVLTTGILSFCSGGYALYTMFSTGQSPEFFGFTFGLIWGFIIFNIDRSIVSSMRKEIDGSKSKFEKFIAEFLPSIPRILLAIILGFIISKPLELRFFQDQIEIKFQENKAKDIEKFANNLRNQDYKARLDQISPNFIELENNIKKAEEQVKEKDKQFIEEMDARGGTKVYGYGNVAKEKQKALQKANESLISAKKLYDDEMSKWKQNKERMNIENEIVEKQKIYGDTINNDFSQRLQAFWDLTVEKTGVKLANWAIIILLIVIELTPIFVKLLSQSGTYDSRLSMKEKATKEEAKLKKDAEVKVTEIKAGTAIDEAKQLAVMFHEETKFRTNGLIQISNHRYQTMVEHEKLLNENFFKLANSAREEIIKKKIAQWKENANELNAKPFNDLYKEKKDNIDIDLKNQ